MSSAILKLIDLIEDIKNVDKIIALHSGENAENGNIMLSQYEAKKVKLTSYLLSELTTPRFSSASSLLFIKQFLEKYYADAASPNDTDNRKNEIRQLESAI